MLTRRVLAMPTANGKPVLPGEPVAGAAALSKDNSTKIR
jgi:hypothetical protein